MSFKTKHIFVRVAAVVWALVGVSAYASAQSFDAIDVRDPIAQAQAMQSMIDNPYEGEVELDENGNPIIKEEQADSVKVKEIMPLESYFFDDSVRRRKHFVWVADTYTNHVKMGEVDTLLSVFNVDYPFMVEDVGDANVGILGGVSTPLNYFRRPDGNDFTFTDGYYSYLITPENARHYNNKRPYTIFAYQTAGQKRYAEESLKVMHAQNITPSTGFNLTYNTYHSRGIYNWQRGKVTDFSAGIYHTGKRYSVHAGVVNNTISQRENGGLVEPWHLTDTLYESAAGMPMKMTDALNKANNTGFYAVQAFGVPLVPLTDSVFTMADRTAFYIGHSISYNKWARNYSDTYKGTTYRITDRQGKVVDTRNFYDNWYVSPTESNDSLAESLLTNRLFVQLQPYDREGVIGTIDGGIGWDMYQYMQFRLKDYITGYQSTKHNSYYAYADIRGKVSKYLDYHGFMRYNLAGYRAGDVDIDADGNMYLYIKEQPIILSGRFGFRLQEPSHWAQNYFSNHLEVTLRIPAWGTHIGFMQTLLGNHVYYGADATPSQMAAAVSVTGLYLRQDFTFGGLHLNHRVLLQYSTDESVVSVPTVAANLSYFYQFQPVKDVLTVKVGVDAWYNTPYYAQGYNPATMMFYNQREALVGDYPYVNAYLVAKWKRMRIFVQYQHASENLFENFKASYSLPYYPYNRALLKYGFSWYFDD